MYFKIHRPGLYILVKRDKRSTKTITKRSCRPFTQFNNRTPFTSNTDTN